jgi:hypothetical protein
MLCEPPLLLRILDVIYDTTDLVFVLPLANAGGGDTDGGVRRGKEAREPSFTLFKEFRGGQDLMESLWRGVGGVEEVSDWILGSGYGGRHECGLRNFRIELSENSNSRDEAVENVRVQRG